MGFVQAFMRLYFAVLLASVQAQGKGPNNSRSSLPVTI